MTIIDFTSALCAQTDPEIFFPDQGESNIAAKAICQKCIHIDDCLENVLADANSAAIEGIFGGTTQRERRTIRQRRAKDVA